MYTYFLFLVIYLRDRMSFAALIGLAMQRKALGTALEGFSLIVFECGLVKSRGRALKGHDNIYSVCFSSVGFLRSSATPLGFYESTRD